jgi:hypothetical protein
LNSAEWLGFAAEILVAVFLVIGHEVPRISGVVRLVPILRLRVDAGLQAMPGTRNG